MYGERKDSKIWKSNEVKPIDRLLSKSIDILIVYGLYYSFYLIILIKADTISIRIERSLFLLIFMFYDMISLIFMDTTIGRKSFRIKFESKTGDVGVFQVIGRSVMIFGLIGIVAEVGGLIFVSIYYVIMISMNSHSPIWDFYLKPVQKELSSGIGLRRFFGGLVVISLLYTINDTHQPSEGMFMDYVERSFDAQIFNSVATSLKGNYGTKVDDLAEVENFQKAYDDGLYEEAKSIGEQLIKRYLDIGEETYERAMTVGDMYSYNFYYDEAIAIYERIVKEEIEYTITIEQWENAFYQLVTAYYSSDYYERILEVVNTYGSKEKNLNYDYFLGMAYLELADYPKAIQHFEEAIQKEPETVYLYEELAYAYLYDHQYARSILWINNGLAIDAENVNLLESKNYILKLFETNVAQYIFDFIELNYIYFENTKEYEALKNELIYKETLTENQYIDIMRTVFGKDYFSFILFGEYYKDYVNELMEASVSFKTIDETTEYIDINYFGTTTDSEVLAVLKSIENPLQKDLIIDLRTNFGGDVESAFNILDNILPTMYIGMWDAEGTDNDYYFNSDGNHIDFHHIYIWVDDESASSSEILSLGLMEGLENVTMIGEQTFGKGVGQIGVENYIEQYALLVVNAYWYIQGINIHEVGITPDIRLKNGDDEAYLEAVKSHQNK